MLKALDSVKWLSPVLLRAVVGLVFIVHGKQKLFGGMEGFTQYVTTGLHLPALLAWAAACTEFFGGVALILGLLTRLSALGIACVMAVAVFRVHWAAGLTGDGGYEFPLTLLCASISLMLTGGGPLSLDSWLLEKKS
jgi:putative oxidoreductase